jgi:hypothetical protein
MIKNYKVILLAICLVSLNLCMENRNLKTQTQQQRNPYPFVRSANSGNGVTIRFINSQKYRVRLYWVDYLGILDHIRDLSPGESYTQKTYAGSAWVWMSYTKIPHGYYVATNGKHQHYRI